MRNVILLTVGALLALGPSTLGQKPAGSKASTLYKQGLHAIDQGQADLARACFQEVLRLQPSNTSAKFQLKQLNVTSGSLLAKKRQLQLKKIIIPVVDFDDLTKAGFDTGGTDGRVGNDTMKAIKDFQIKAGLLPADGYGGLKVLARLRQGG